MLLKKTTKSTSCKICNNTSVLYGVCDFNKSCEERKGKFLPLCGVPIYYHQCEFCGLIFTEAFDNWSSEEFKTYIYNDEYITVDPAWGGKRATEDADLVLKLFQPTTVVDYGGGAGLLAKILNEHNYDATTFDPYFDANSTVTKADLVTCFEVYEHTIDPHKTVEECKQLMNQNSQLFISTLAVDFLNRRAVDNASGASFIAPRNGHVTIHTKRSLKVLFDMHGMKLLPTNPMLCRDELVPDIERFFIAVYK